MLKELVRGAGPRSIQTIQTCVRVEDGHPKTVAELDWLARIGFYPGYVVAVMAIKRVGINTPLQVSDRGDELKNGSTLGSANLLLLVSGAGRCSRICNHLIKAPSYLIVNCLMACDVFVLVAIGVAAGALTVALLTWLKEGNLLAAISKMCCCNALLINTKVVGLAVVLATVARAGSVCAGTVVGTFALVGASDCWIFP